MSNVCNVFVCCEREREKWTVIKCMYIIMIIHSNMGTMNVSKNIKKILIIICMLHLINSNIASMLDLFINNNKLNKIRCVKINYLSVSMAISIRWHHNFVSCLNGTNRRRLKEKKQTKYMANVNWWQYSMSKSIMSKRFKVFMWISHISSISASLYLLYFKYFILFSIR